VFDLRPALEAAAAGGILNARQLEGVATSMESAFELKAAAAAAAAADGTAKLVEEKQQRQQQQRYRYPCLAQLASGIQEREQQTLRAIRSCIR
jgi:DNA mismatch repair protein MutS2